DKVEQQAVIRNVAGEPIPVHCQADTLHCELDVSVNPTLVERACAVGGAQGWTVRITRSLPLELFCGRIDPKMRPKDGARSLHFGRDDLKGTLCTAPLT